MISRQFQGVTPERWASIKTVFAHETGVWIQNDEGSGSTHGINFNWLMAQSGELTVSLAVPHFGFVLKLAHLTTEQDVIEKFTAWIDGVK